MQTLSELRQNTFNARQTLTLFYSEPDGDPTLLQILCERKPSDSLTKGIRGLVRPSFSHRSIVTAHSNSVLKTEQTAHQTRNQLGSADQLHLQAQPCLVHEDEYPEIVDKFIEKLGLDTALQQETANGREIFFPLRAGEILSVAIFDLSFLADS